MTRLLTKSMAVLAVVLFAGLTAQAGAANFETKNKLVIQVSSADPAVQNLALNNAVNVQKALGMENVEIEVVAYGPGLSLLTDKSGQKARVSSLALQDITFSACGNTMKAVAKKTGAMPTLIEGVKVVPAGVLRIMELQQQGYTYVRP